MEINVSTLEGFNELPLVVQPVEAGRCSAEDLVAFISGRHDWLKSTLHRHGGVLFRGFASREIDEFQRRMQNHRRQELYFTAMSSLSIEAKRRSSIVVRFTKRWIENCEIDSNDLVLNSSRRCMVRNEDSGNPGWTISRPMTALLLKNTCTKTTSDSSGPLTRHCEPGQSGQRFNVIL